MLLPVGGAVASVVAPNAIVRSSPGNGGARPATDFAPECHSVAALTCYIGDRDEEFWRCCRGKIAFEITQFFQFYRKMQCFVKRLFRIGTYRQE